MAGIRQSSVSYNRDSSGSFFTNFHRYNNLRQLFSLRMDFVSLAPHLP